ncbi:hypothetical protein FIA58_003790 [Flavobacterium jejuense]|uniref:Lipoprotein n=1 Tax=Flavobacterium jejuense TaxID=1544455 RepID=A0ABX0IP00_9FLAO|nr:hypothetical protein [Flavobacterium jejuense]NHN24790.1 hypothetical protein [Flavobacterium jejuense]
MKQLLLILTILLLSCQSKKENETKPSLVKDSLNETVAVSEKTFKKETFWKGYINKSIPIYLHYQIENKIAVGEIIYLNTKEKLPIKVIGTVNEGNFRLLEFESSGNITGIISGKITNDNHFTGDWFSPKNSKNFTLNLTAKDTTLVSPSIKPDTDEMFGKYHYQYSEEGYQGDFSMEKINKNEVVFEIFSVTGEPSRNMAVVERDTILLTSNSFIYNIANTEDCEFEVTIYKDFITINYTQEYCNSQFGHNATVEGIFLKVK